MRESLFTRSALVVVLVALGAGTGATQPPTQGAIEEAFSRAKASVVAVRTSESDGVGVIVDPSGLVVTSSKNTGSEDYVAVQFDSRTKVSAQRVYESQAEGLLVLRVALDSLPGARATDRTSGALRVGQRVFSVSSPLRGKALITGVVSAESTDGVKTDLRLPSNSGGAGVFDEQGSLTGLIDEWGEGSASGPGHAAIERALAAARPALAGLQPPSATPLPVEPEEPFPPDALRSVRARPLGRDDDYSFDLGDFRIHLLTPQALYYVRHEEAIKEERKAAQKTGAKPVAAESDRDLRDYKAVLLVQANSKKPKERFDRMRLFCGATEVVPIDPARVTRTVRLPNGREVGRFVNGFYTFRYDALTAACSVVKLELYAKDRPVAVTKTLDASMVQRVISDLAAHTQAAPQR